jgi:hypothetical protein
MKRYRNRSLRSFTNFVARTRPVFRLFPVPITMATIISSILNKIAIGSAALGLGTLLAGQAWCVGSYLSYFCSPYHFWTISLLFAY